MASLAAVFMLVGLFAMALAGVQYWRSDPMVFLLTPVWQGHRQRSHFCGPGWGLYLTGNALAAGGIAVLVISRFVG